MDKCSPEQTPNYSDLIPDGFQTELPLSDDRTLETLDACCLITNGLLALKLKSNGGDHPGTHFFSTVFFPRD